MNSRFSDINNFCNAFRFIENPWAATTKDMFEVNILNCYVGLLKSELIDLQQDITLKDILIVRIMQWNFGIHLIHQYPSFLPNVRAILKLFESTYLCEATFRKLTLIKNKYRNRLSNAHLDNLLRLSTSKTSVDINKIIKETERFRLSTSNQH